MAARPQTSYMVVGPLVSIVDDMEESHVEWYEAAIAVAHTYSDWAEAPPDQRAERYATYISALDRQEAAASRYAGLVADVMRLVHRTRGTEGT